MSSFIKKRKKRKNFTLILPQEALFTQNPPSKHNKSNLKIIQNQNSCLSPFHFKQQTQSEGKRQQMVIQQTFQSHSNSPYLGAAPSGVTAKTPDINNDENTTLLAIKHAFNKLNRNINRNQIDTPLPNRISFFSLRPSPEHHETIFFKKSFFFFFGGLGHPTHKNPRFNPQKKTFKGVATNPHIHIIHYIPLKFTLLL